MIIWTSARAVTGRRTSFAQRAALKPASPAGPRSPVEGCLRLTVLTEALERLFYDDLDASCHARHVDWAATSNLARDRLWCVVVMVE